MTKQSKDKASAHNPKQEPQDTIVLEVLGFEPLTEDEEKEKLRLERKVERSFYEAGIALKLLRDGRYYRNTHTSFESYCQDRFGYRNRRHPYRLIEAAVTIDNLLKNCDQFGHIESPLIPVNESQARPLTGLDNPSQQVKAWTQAIEKAGGKIPPARIVKEVVQSMQQPRKVPNPWRVGEVAQIIIKGNPDLKGKGRCWAVITTVHDFSCSVQLWDGNYQVKPENLKDLPYSNEQQEEVRKLSDRLSKLYDPEMEETAKAVLASLGKIDRPWLTEIEESLLGILEEKMKQVKKEKT